MTAFVHDIRGRWWNLSRVQSAHPTRERDRHGNELVVCTLEDGSEFQAMRSEWEDALRTASCRVIPAREGFELLWMQDGAPPSSQPIIGWSVGPGDSVLAITASGVCDAGTMIKQPDGSVVAPQLDAEYPDVEAAVKGWSEQKL